MLEWNDQETEALVLAAIRGATISGRPATDADIDRVFRWAERARTGTAEAETDPPPPFSATADPTD